MKNRILLSSLSVIGLLTLTACSTDNKETTTQVEKSIDSSFINDLEIEIQNRWDYNDGTASGEIEIDSNTEYLETLLSFEHSLYKYADEEFDNPRLKALALDYIKGLKLQEEAIPFYDIDYLKYDDLWLKGFDLRSTTLLSLIEEFGLKVDEEQFKELKVNAQQVNQQNETKKKIDEMVKRIQFTKVKTEHGWTTYSATIENTSGVNLEWFDININLIDENDVVIDTESAYHSNVWKPNQKVLFDFNTQNTDFTKMEWEAEYSIIE